MMNLAPVIFAVLSAVFFGLYILDRVRSGTRPNPARKARGRIAVIFALVALALFVMHLLQGF